MVELLQKHLHHLLLDHQNTYILINYGKKKAHDLEEKHMLGKEFNVLAIELESRFSPDRSEKWLKSDDFY